MEKGSVLRRALTVVAFLVLVRLVLDYVRETSLSSLSLRYIFLVLSRSVVRFFLQLLPSSFSLCLSLVGPSALFARFLALSSPRPS